MSPGIAERKELTVTYCREKLEEIDLALEELGHYLWRISAEDQLRRNRRRGGLLQTRQFFAAQLESALTREGFPGRVKLPRWEKSNVTE